MWKTGTLPGTSSAVTTYFLYDGGGHPVVEEDASGQVGAASGWAADGLRARYQAADGLAYQFSFDPQGDVVERQTRGAFQSGSWAYDVSAYEAYGALRADWGAFNNGNAFHLPAHRDPAGFGGQFGYYTDLETGNATAPGTGLLCLTHRYYDPGTGRFLNRDPSGYRGGVNLYGFAGDNPVNEIDPSGLRPVRSPGFFLESLIPVWGSGREAVHDFQSGKPGGGLFNTALAISDVVFVKSLYTDIGKVGLKGLIKISGSHSWGATKTWMKKGGWIEYSGQHFHHWLFERNQGIGKAVPNWLKNQPWNLKGIPLSLAQRYGVRSIDIHNAIHGKSLVLKFNAFQRLWYGTPNWLKPTVTSGIGRIINQMRSH